MPYTLEKHLQIYDDNSGEYIEVCPDADGLDLIDIRQCESSGKIDYRMTFSKEQALLIIKALQEIIDRPF